VSLSIYRDSASGEHLVHGDHKVAGSNVLQATALQGYALTEYPDGMEKEGVNLPWVDNYIAYFNQLEKTTFAAHDDSPIVGLSTPLQLVRSTRSARRSSIQCSSDPGLNF
jgi:hypothetical protein